MTTQTQAWRNRIVGEEDVAPDQLLANPLNFRVHPTEQQLAMAGALDEIGWIQRVVVNKRTGNVVDGHLRVQLALRKGAPTVPCLYVDLTDAEERLALATLDPISAMAVTDKAVLADLLGSIDRQNEALQGLLDQLAKQAKGVNEDLAAGATDPNAVPALRAEATSQLGDLWQLGPHLLVVGDSTEAAPYEALLGLEHADAVWTDPPYNVAYETAAGAIANDNQEKAAFAEFLRKAFEHVGRATKAGGGIYVAHSDSERPAFQAALEAGGFLVKQCLVWVKNAAVLSRQDYNWRHEPVLYGWREGAAHYFGFDFTETTVIDDTADLTKLSRKQLEGLCTQLLQRPTTTVHYHDRPARSELHPTMKPVELITQMIGNSTRRGDVVLDPFGGSGSTLIAAAMLGRFARLIELDPCYADVIVERWQGWSAMEATLAGTEHTYAQVAAERKRARRAA